MSNGGNIYLTSDMEVHTVALIRLSQERFLIVNSDKIVLSSMRIHTSTEINLIQITLTTLSNPCLNLKNATLGHISSN